MNEVTTLPARRCMGNIILRGIIAFLILRHNNIECYDVRALGLGDVVVTSTPVGFFFFMFALARNVLPLCVKQI